MLRGCEGVAQEHRDRHRTDAARNRRHQARDVETGRVDVSDELALVRAVDADVDHRRARLHHVRRDEAAAPDGRDEDVRLGACATEIGACASDRSSPSRARARRSIAIGLPTISLRPMTTASLPFSSTPVLLEHHHDARGRAPARGRARRDTAAPRSGRGSRRRPSRDRRHGARSARPCAPGSGSWTRMPSTASSAFSSSMSSRTTHSGVSDGKRWSRESMPASCEALCFEPTYVCDAGSSPTRIVARQTGWPYARTSSATCARTFSASAFPSIRTAVIARNPTRAARTEVHSLANVGGDGSTWARRGRERFARPDGYLRIHELPARHRARACAGRAVRPDGRRGVEPPAAAVREQARGGRGVLVRTRRRVRSVDAPRHDRARVLRVPANGSATSPTRPRAPATRASRSRRST